MADLAEAPEVGWIPEEGEVALMWDLVVCDGLSLPGAEPTALLAGPEVPDLDIEGEGLPRCCAIEVVVV